MNLSRDSQIARLHFIQATLATRRNREFCRRQTPAYTRLSQGNSTKAPNLMSRAAGSLPPPSNSASLAYEAVPKRMCPFLPMTNAGGPWAAAAGFPSRGT